MNPQERQPEERFLALKDCLERDGYVVLPGDQTLVEEDQRVDPNVAGLEKAYYYNSEDGNTVVVYDPNRVRIHTERGDTVDSVANMNRLTEAGASRVPYTDLFVEKIEQE
jgi:hypothetical protein